MSGIAGIWNRGGAQPVAAGALDAMLAAMASRARDGRGSMPCGEAGLANAWLNASGEREPGLARAAGRAVVITADARLDNRRELLAALGEGETDRSDAVLILRSYMRWGKACTDRLVGDFAFVIWDGDRRELFAARDHFGVKPFYYFVDDRRFVFASEIGPVLLGGRLPRVADEGWIATFLANLQDDMERTPYSGVRALPAGHRLLLMPAVLNIERYWQPTPRRGRPEGDAAEEFRSIFRRSVADRMRGGRVGAMLSGGLDSSSIVCVADALLASTGGDPLHTYSLIFPRDSGMDESRYIDAVRRRIRCVPRLLKIEQERPFASAAEILDEQEGPYLSPGLATTRRLYRAAAEDDRRILLNGHGGDEIVSHAFPWLNELALNGRWFRLWREVRGVARLHDTGSVTTYMAILSAFGPTARLARLGRRLSRFRTRATGSQDQTPAWRRIIDHSLLARTDLVKRHRAATRERRSHLADERRHHLWQVSSGQVGHAFQILDKAAAAAGVEARYPFWDKELVEFCLSLPSEEKLQGGWSRLVLRRAMDGILPSEVQWRTDKVDFRNNLVSGMLSNHAGLLERTFNADADLIAPYVDVMAARLALARVRENPVSVPLEDILDVWRATWLSQWLMRLEGAKVAA